MRDVTAVYPEIIVTAVAMIVLVADAVLDRRRAPTALPIITIAGLVVALASVFNDVPAGQYFRGFVTVDAFATFFRAVFIILAIFAAAVSPAYLARRMVPAGEYYAIICFSTVGAMTPLGLGFQAAIVPCHQWSPDAYDGAPAPATAFMSVGPKAAAFAAILRVMVGALGPLSVDWSAMLAVLAAATMTGGNIVALAQTNTKRMLAYSSIAHTGYILAAVAAAKAGPSAGAAVLFYVFAYGLMNLGAFACLLYMDLEGTRGATLDELNGFARRQPLGALAFAVFLVSLTGIPPTIGFVAKFVVIQPVLDAGMAWLAVVIALNAVLAAFYYLRVVVHMYMYEPEGKVPRLIPGRGLSISLGLASLAVVVLGILPNSIYEWAREAALPLVR